MAKPHPQSWSAQSAHRQRVALEQQLQSQYPSLAVQPLTNYTLALHTRVRVADASTPEFVAAADPLLRQLVEFAVGLLPSKNLNGPTPTGALFFGCVPAEEYVGVSIMRAGESMEAALRLVCPSVRIGKILIQRDESVAAKPAQLFYSKLPPAIDGPTTRVLLLDPMLASGGSAICAVRHLLSKGVSIHQITFVNLISCPAGLHALLSAFPQLQVFTGYIDPELDERKYIVPGVGDFGDRYFGTVPQQEE